KLHGTLADRSTWVLTRDAYDRAMYADPLHGAGFSALLHSCPILFVGYELAEDDLDHLLGKIRSFAGDQPPRHFALVAAEAVKPYRRHEVEKAGVRVIPYKNGDGSHAEVVRLLRRLAASAHRGLPACGPFAAVSPTSVPS